MEEIEVITLEDGIDYYVVETIANGTDQYVFLASKEEPKEIIIRKITTENGNEIIEGLKDQSELQLALELYTKKHIEN